MSIFHRQPRGGDAVGRLLQSAWRYKGLIATAVLLGALLGYGWASRQPTLYEGVSRMLIINNGCPPNVGCLRLRDRAQQVLSSPAVLERAAKLSRSRVSAETLGQRLQVDVAQDADVITIRVVDSTATGAARLVDAVTLAYQEVVAKQVRERSREVVSQLRNTQSRLQTRLAEINAELAGRPNDLRLRAQRKAVANELLAIRQAIAVEATHRPSLDPDPPTVSNQPIALRPGRPMAIGMLAGLLASTVLAWWLSRPSGTLTMAAAGGR